jgi:hypothetical protein
MKQIIDKLRQTKTCSPIFKPIFKMGILFTLTSIICSSYCLILFITGLLMLSSPSAAQAISEVTILRKQAQMRKGPASYYEVISSIPEHTTLTPVENVMNWHKVAYDGKTGFISAKVTQPLAPKEDVFSQIATQSVNMKLSRHGMSAGAKGFAKRFSDKIEGDADLADEMAAFQLDPAAYTAFASETYKEQDVEQFRGQVALPSDGTRSAYSSVEEGLGMSIAAKIGALKLMQNPELNQYINQVGQLVVAASSGFDLPFRFFIIDDPKRVNAYGCPGGYIFVTRGLLGHIKNEAELAAVLAHEVAHVTYQHGLTEITLRNPILIVENAMDELDEETASKEDAKWKAIEDDLDQFALEAYETIFGGRLARYELDADRIGLIYTARSGYDPKALETMLARLKKARTKSTNEHYTFLQIEQRLKGIKVALNSIPPELNYFHFTERWQKNTMVLR